MPISANNGILSAGLGATLLGVGRSPEKAVAVAERLRRESGNPAVEFLVADLSVQAQVRRLAGTGVTVNAVHPGFVATNIGMDDSRWMKLAKPLIKVLAQSPEEGAQTSIYMATSPEVEGVTGGYFAKKQPLASSAVSYDEADAGRLWQIGAATSGL